MGVIYKGHIYSNFEGYYENAIFRMDDDTYWIQAIHFYWYHHDYRPEALISEKNGEFILTIKMCSIPVIKFNPAVENIIDFKSYDWYEYKRRKLINKRGWKECEYKYNSEHDYRAKAVIFVETENCFQNYNIRVV